MDHAQDWLLFEDNIGESLSIDETCLSSGEVYTFLTNKAGKGRKGTLVAVVKGTKAEDVIQDFPLRGKAVYLHVRRRKWRDSSNGEIFTYSYDDLTAEGSKLSPEFVSFLKE